MFMHIAISIPEQSLTLFDDHGTFVSRYPVSTAANGVGCVKDSGCTPLGKHVIRAKIGAGAPENTVFVGRRPTGEIFAPELKTQFPERDWILTRILWLSGSEPGKNRLGNVDTMQRYIYIHGSPDQTEFGAPGSHGCVRMRNADLIALFDQVPAGTTVDILDQDADGQQARLQTVEELASKGQAGEIKHSENKPGEINPGENKASATQNTPDITAGG
jgi:L,D-transpeptidase YbiS